MGDWWSHAPSVGFMELNAASLALLRLIPALLDEGLDNYPGLCAQHTFHIQTQSLLHTKNGAES